MLNGSKNIANIYGIQIYLIIHMRKIGAEVSMPQGTKIVEHELSARKV